MTLQFNYSSIVDLLLFCSQNASTSDRCLADGKRATSTRSFLPNHNGQPSVHIGIGVSNVAHGTKSSVLPLKQPVHSISTSNSVTTTYAVKPRLPTPVIKPLVPNVTTSTYNSTPATHHTGQLLVILKTSLNVLCL